MEEMMEHRGDGNATHGNIKEQKTIKTLDNVFDNVTSFERLYDAYLHARKQKRYRDEVLKFSSDLDSNLLRIQKELRDGTFRFGPYRKHWVYVPKKRLVMALPFESRIVQWAIYLELNPFYEKLFIEDSYACRAGKGSLAAVQRLQYWMRGAESKQGDWYTLKLDISKYFYRVDHDVLLDILGRRISDPRLMQLIRNIVSSDGEKFGLPRFTSAEDILAEQWLGDVGMPIGNLTSQLFANIYLNELDQYCKHILGIRKYIRYMDDIDITARTKADVARYREEIPRFLMEHLHLDLNSKTAMRPLDRVEFVGYIVSAKNLKLRKQTVRRIKGAYHGICRKYFEGEMTKVDFDRRTASYKGMISHADSDKLRKRLNEIYIFEKQKAEMAA
jgi:retron-type reverse transcriptase